MILAAAGILLPSFVSNAADDAEPEIRAFAIPTIEKLGQQIYAQDHLASRATDLIVAKRTEKGFIADGVKGWITGSLGGKDVVRFMRIGERGPEVLYDVTFAKGGEPTFSTPTSRTLTSDELAQYNARTLAHQNVEKRCAERYNTVALKDPESDGWLVWALASTLDPDVILIGGHYRFTISADGKSIRARDVLSKNCLRFSRGERAKEPGVDFMSHVVSLTPVETHAFASLTYQTVLHVGTNDGKAWRIDAGRVTTVEQDSPGLDGFAARAIAAIDELCTFIVSKPGEEEHQHTGSTKVIRATEHDKTFSVEGPPGAHVEMIACMRRDIVPSPNDYKVVTAGYPLSIADRGTGHANRMGTLVLVDGQFQFQIYDGDEPLTDELAARVRARLEAFQKEIRTQH